MGPGFLFAGQGCRTLVHLHGLGETLPGGEPGRGAGGDRIHRVDDVPHERSEIFAAVKFDHLLGVDHHGLAAEQPWLGEGLPGRDPGRGAGGDLGHCSLCRPC